MEEQRQRELRGLLHMLERTAKLAEDSVRTGTFKNGETRCITQFNDALTRLNTLDVIPIVRFEPLNADASFREISIAYQQLAAYLNDELADSTTSQKWMSGFLGKRLSENLDENFSEGRLGELIRKSMPDFLTESTLKDVEQSFPVMPGGTLTIETAIGNVDIQAAETDTVELRIHRAAQLKTDRRAGNILKNFVVDIVHDTANVNIEANFKGSQWKKVVERLDIQFEITVPRHYHLDLKTGFGNISMVSIEGNVNASTSAGELRFEHIQGELTGKSSSGNIHINGYEGNVHVRASAGNIDVKNGSGEVNAKNASGHLRFVNITGDIFGRSSGGNIILSACETNVDVRASGGNIEIENHGPVNAKAAGGSIRAHMLRQGQTADSETPYWILETIGGSTDIFLAPNISLTVDAKCLGGTVKTQFPVEIEIENTVRQGRLEAPINGGGPLLKLYCLGGAITLNQTKESGNAEW